MDEDDEHHEVCLELLSGHVGPLLVPTLCLSEVSCILGRSGRHSVEVRLLGDLALGNYILEPVEPSDLVRTAELVERYSDLPLGTVDASVVAAAERLDVTTIATLDRRDFSVVRPAHVGAFTLVP